MSNPKLDLIEFGTEALDTAASRGHIGVLELLIDAGVPIDSPLNRLPNILFSSAFEWKKECFEWIWTKRDWAIDEKDKEGRSLLFAAVLCGAKGVADLIASYLVALAVSSSLRTVSMASSAIVIDSFTLRLPLRM